MKDPHAFALQELKSDTLAYLNLLIAAAPEVLTRQEYKKYFERRYNLTPFELPHVRALDWVEFSIGSTHYRVRNEKTHLSVIREQVAQLPLKCFEIEPELSKFSTNTSVLNNRGIETPPKARKNQGFRPSSRRISDENIAYYNEYRPRGFKIRDFQNAIRKTFFGGITSDGYFTHEGVAIKINDDNDVNGAPQINVSVSARFRDLFTKEPYPVEKIYEFSTGIGKPMAHVVGSHGISAVYNAEYLDVVMTEYPSAVAELYAISETYALLFRQDSSTKAIIMPLELNKHTIDFLSEWDVNENPHAQI